METLTTCMLSLPNSEGGFGFHAPSLNHRVKLDETASRLAGQSFCFLDIAWPDQKRALEYDGAAWHQNPRAYRKRREALAQMGWTTNVIALEEMTDFTELMKTVALIDGIVPRDDGGQSRGTQKRGTPSTAAPCDQIWTRSGSGTLRDTHQAWSGYLSRLKSDDFTTSKFESHNYTSVFPIGGRKTQQIKLLIA